MSAYGPMDVRQNGGGFPKRVTTWKSGERYAREISELITDFRGGGVGFPDNGVSCRRV
jgi:hypothetical protein